MAARKRMAKAPKRPSVYRPEPASELGQIREAERERQRSEIRAALAKHGSYLEAVAEECGITRSALAYRMKRLGFLDAPKEA